MVSTSIVGPGYDVGETLGGGRGKRCETAVPVAKDFIFVLMQG